MFSVHASYAHTVPGSEVFASSPTCLNPDCPPPAMTKVAFVSYSTDRHCVALAAAIKKGAEQVPGVDAAVYQTDETLPSTCWTRCALLPRRSAP